MYSKTCQLAFDEEFIIKANSATADLPMPQLIKDGANESKPSLMQTSGNEALVSGRIHVSF